MILGDRRWRIRGLAKNLSYELLKINLMVSKVAAPLAPQQPNAFHVDSLDLYNARQRQAYIKQAALELHVSEGVIQNDLGQILLQLETLQDKHIKEVLTPQEKKVELTDEEREVALDLLKDPRLLERILEDFNRCGIVGEETNKLLGYIAAVSRKLDEPLAIVIQSSSAAGKTSLMEAILAFLPTEERVKYSAMTGQSLFYMGETNLKHKILAIVEEEGAEKASYALKLLQSEGELTIASTGKDPATGKLITHEYHVEGPVMIFLTTTAIEIDEELQNRCIVLCVDEDREQTRAIHRMQRKLQTLEGLLRRQDRDVILKVHQNAQRLLQSLLVANPYAEQLTFLDDRTRMRRDHMKYLTLIRSIALLHQYQRPQKAVTHQGKTVTFIEVTQGDIRVANRLAHQILGRSLDELSPQTRRLLMILDEMVQKNCEALAMSRRDYRFSRREVIEHTGWSYKQVRLHVERLLELEYLILHRGIMENFHRYELVYHAEGQDGSRFYMGLMEVEFAQSVSTTDDLPMPDGGLAHNLPMACPAFAHDLTMAENEKNTDEQRAKCDLTIKPAKNAYKGNGTKKYVLITPAHHNTQNDPTSGAIN